MGLLGEVATDAERALRAVEGDEQLMEADDVAEAARLLRVSWRFGGEGGSALAV
jgi:hypothetical protein